MPFLKKIISQPVMLTVAGSDSGSGAGIQIDIKTASALNVFCTTAITALTAQNPDEVIGIRPIEPEFVSLQIKAVAKAFKIKAIKTGMLYNSEIIREVASSLKKMTIKPIVVDPVLIATSGKNLMLENAIKTLKEQLLPISYVITPNINEAEALLNFPIKTLSDAEDAARELGKMYETNCVVKGGHLQGKDVCDILYYEGKVHIFKKKRVEVAKTHGTGCMFSAAIAALLSRGVGLKESVERAQEFVWKALTSSVREGRIHSLL